jgi:hypothetical protein
VFAIGDLKIGNDLYPIFFLPWLRPALSRKTPFFGRARASGKELSSSPAAAGAPGFTITASVVAVRKSGTSAGAAKSIAAFTVLKPVAAIPSGRGTSAIRIVCPGIVAVLRGIIPASVVVFLRTIRLRSRWSSVFHYIFPFYIRLKDLNCERKINPQNALRPIKRKTKCEDRFFFVDEFLNSLIFKEGSEKTFIYQDKQIRQKKLLLKKVFIIKFSC